jgi:hypothetical protein
MHKGTLGCFLSHVLFWEAVVREELPWAMVVEDDADVAGISVLESLAFPAGIDIVFCNERTEYLVSNSDSIGFQQFLPAISFAQSHGQSIGTDGYMVSQAGAQRLLRFVGADGLFTHVDLRLAAYSIKTTDLQLLETELPMIKIIASLRQTYAPAHRLEARVLVPSITRHLKLDGSRRDDEDRLSRLGRAPDASKASAA